MQFNHAAGLLQEGKHDEAAELLRQTAAAADKDVAAKSSALLGQIDVAKAKGTDSNAEDIAELLDKAEEHFATSMVLRDDADVRKNLENLRAWRAKTADEQKTAERIQNRNTELQERIRLLANEENKLIAASQQSAEEPFSPKVFQQNYESAQQQHILADELTHLSQTPLDAGTKDNGTQDKERQEKFRRLPEIQKIAEDAAKDLAGNNVKEALAKQREVYAFLQSLLQNQNGGSGSDNKNQNKENQDEEKKNKNQQPDKQRQNDEQQQDKQSGQPPEQPSDENTEKNDGQQKEPEKNVSALKEEESKDEAKNKAERMLLQVRRKQQEAEKRREQLKMLQQKSNPVEKDW